MKEKYILIALALLSVFLYGADIATAETGTISLNVIDSLLDYQNPGTASNFGNPTMTTFNVYNTGWNSIQELYITLPATQNRFILNGNSTYFTCSSGCTGSGFVSYNALGTATIDWLFNSDFVITNSQFVLSYSVNIFDSNNLVFTSDGTRPIDSTDSPSATRPVYLRGGSGTRSQWKFYNDGNSLHYNAIMKTSTSELYNVTYPLSGYYQVQIDKQNSIGIKNYFANSTANQWNEATFNTVDFTSPLLPYTTGLYINLTTAGGSHNNVLINSTGITSNIPSSGSGGSPTGQIYYDFASGTLGSAYGINASINASNFSAFTTYYINATSPTGQVYGFPTSFSTQTYSTGRLWSFDTIGTYNATLQYCNIFDITCSNVLGILHDMDTATIIINPVVYNFSLTTDQANYNIGNNISIRAVNPSPNPYYVTVIGTGQLSGIIFSDIAYNTIIPAVSTTYINTTLTTLDPIGTYQVNMAQYTSGAGRVASANFNVTSPTPGSVVSIAWNGALFDVGRTGTISYTSNQNTSTITVYAPNNTQIDQFTNTTSSGTKSYVFDVPGTWRANIVDNGNAANNSNATTNVIITQIVNKTKDYTLPTFVYWDQYVYHTGDPYAISYKIDPLKLGLPIAVNLVVYDPNGNVVYNTEVCSATTCPLNALATGVSGTISGTFSTTATLGIWSVKLIRDGTLEAKFQDGNEIASNLAQVVPITTTPTTPANQTNNFLTTAFIPLLLMMLFVGAGAMIGGSPGLIIGFSSGFIYLSIFGYIPLWGIMLFALVVIIIFAILFGRKAAEG